MTAGAIHVITLKPHKRGPFADPLFTPTCAKCGPLTDKPTDREDARNIRAKHEAQARDGVIV